MDTFTLNTNWQHSRADDFWGEIASCDHVVQFYEDDSVLMDSLTGFVGWGIKAGDTCIVIATKEHLESLESRLKSLGLHLDHLVTIGRYFPLVAEDMLSQFMVDGMPDEKLFNQLSSALLTKAGYRKKRIRAFGEMVALLWNQGNQAAAIELENLWNKFCEQKSFCLYCAYPKSAFKNGSQNGITTICSAHSKIIAGTGNQLTEVIYRNTA